ncbi:MAG: pectate lyase [Prevotella sp.]|nr:pectate lyase [Prevotella sp.]
MRRIFKTLILLLAALQAEAQTLENKNAIQTTDSAFFVTSEARRIGDQLLVFQRETGGWPKNVNMVKPMTEEERTQVLTEKDRQDDSTIDNKATITQIAFLARLYHATKDERYKESFRKGMEYLLSGQYDNGGWPQFWPKNRQYQIHITYNDNAMANVMKILRDARQRKEPYTAKLVDDSLQQRCQQAFDKGIECILNTQIMVDGQPTVWCQQHDHVTLQPAKARAYELPSYASLESANLTFLLMQISKPSERVKRAVEGAMRWFEQHKLTGIRVEEYQPSDGGPKDIRIVADSTASPLWARYYDLEEGKPFFCDRDGVPKRDIQDIGYERRNGYGWYNDSPADLYKRYETWKKKYQ